jgi:hypothetical protein
MPATATKLVRARVRDQLRTLQYDLECLLTDGAFLHDLQAWNQFEELATHWLDTIRAVVEGK